MQRMAEKQKRELTTMLTYEIQRQQREQEQQAALEREQLKHEQERQYHIAKQKEWDAQQRRLQEEKIAREREEEKERQRQAAREHEESIKRAQKEAEEAVMPFPLRVRLFANRVLFSSPCHSQKLRKKETEAKERMRQQKAEEWKQDITTRQQVHVDTLQQKMKQMAEAERIRSFHHPSLRFALLCVALLFFRCCVCGGVC